VNMSQQGPLRIAHNIHLHKPYGDALQFGHVAVLTGVFKAMGSTSWTVMVGGGVTGVQEAHGIVLHPLEDTRQFGRDVVWW